MPTAPKLYKRPIIVPVYPIPIDISGSGSTVVVPGVPNKVIIPHFLFGMADSDGELWFESQGGYVMSGPLPMLANQGFVIPEGRTGHGATQPGEGLAIHISTTADFGGILKYSIETPAF